MADNLVEPMGGAPAALPPPVEPTASAQPAPPAVEGTGNQAAIPDEILQIPAFQGLMTGQPPALSADLKSFDNRPEGELLAKNKDTLMQAGIGFYRALSGTTGVVFNSLYLSPEDLKKADKEGRLSQIAPSFDDVNQAVMSSGADNPVLAAARVPAGPSAGAAPQPPQTGSPIPPSSGPPASAQKKLTTARLKNLQAGPPSSGARPGGGRLLNRILQQPV